MPPPISAYLFVGPLGKVKPFRGPFQLNKPFPLNPFRREHRKKCRGQIRKAAFLCSEVTANKEIVS